MGLETRVLQIPGLFAQSALSFNLLGVHFKYCIKGLHFLCGCVWKEREGDRDRQKQREGGRHRDRLRCTGILWVKAEMLLWLIQCTRHHPLQERISLCSYTIAEVEDQCYRYLTSTAAPCFINTGSYKWFRYFQTQQCYRLHHNFALFIQYYQQEPLTLFCVFLILSSGFTVSFLSILSAFSAVVNKETQKQAPLLKSMLQATFLHACSQIGLKMIVDIREEVL